MPARGKPSRPVLGGLALLAAILLIGCGGTGSNATEGAAVTSRSPTAVPQQPRPRQGKQRSHPAAVPCQSRLGSFVASMDSLRRRLAVGVTFDQYLAEVRGIGSTYRKILADKVEIDCLTAVGTPGEKAFNRYIEAANEWGKCVSEAGCSSAAVEPVLQRRWRIASHFLSEADSGLNAGAPLSAGAALGGPGLVHGNERGNCDRAGQDPAPNESPVPGVDSAGRPNQCGA